MMFKISQDKIQEDN